MFAGAVGANVGTQHHPHSVRPCGPVLLAAGVAEGPQRGRCLPPLCGASGVRRCPSPNCPPTGRAVGVRHPRAVGAGVLVWGPNTVPSACMPCGGCVPRGLWGAVPGRGGMPPLRGACGVRRCRPPGRPSSGAGSRGTATRVSRVRSVRAWGPSTGPRACALAGRRCSLWGWRKGVPKGGSFHHCEGLLESGAVPPPTARPLGGPLGSATHVLWARVCGCGGPTLSRWPACPVGAACRGGGEGPAPGGLVCHRCEKHLVSGAVPPPAARPLERAARVPRPVCPGCGRCGRGDQAPAPQRAPLAGRRCSLWGWPKGVPGRGAFHHCEGRLRSGAVPLPTARPLGGLLGSATNVLWARVCGCGGPTLSPSPACPVGAACRGGCVGPSPGGVACHRCEGRLVSGPVPPPAARPLERAAGAPRPVWPGCGRCGRGDPAPAPQRAPLRAGFARCGGGRRASPEGVPSTIVRGVWCQPLSLARPPVLWSGQPGFRDPCVPGAVGAGVGTQQRLHSVRPCGLALLAVGVAEGRPREGCLPPL